MPDQPITADDVGAALYVVVIAMTKAAMNPANQTGAEVIQETTNVIDDHAAAMGDRPAGAILRQTAALLLKTESEPS